MNRLKVGILALQGCVQPHRPHLEALGVAVSEVRTAQDLEKVHGLILPGGESTTLLKLIHALGLHENLKATFQKIPVWGICAGAILMAEKVTSPEQESFALISMEVQRNAYGRQLESFHTKLESYPVVFIRAPKIISVSDSVQVKSEHEGSPVWVSQRAHMATTFHAELTDVSKFGPSPWHREFVERVRKTL